MTTLAYTYEKLQELLIKALIAQPTIIPRISEEITLDDFENSKYKEFYSAILELHSEEKRISPAEIVEIFIKRNIPFLQEDILMFSNPPTDAPTTLARLLKKESVSSKAVYKLTETISSLKEGSDTIELLGTLTDEASRLSARLIDNNTVSFSEQVSSELEKYLSDEEVDNIAIATPYETLNNYLSGGFKAEQLITVGARTGVGKTVVATNCAAKACSEGKSVLFFSLEMSSAELIKRLVACHGNILINQLGTYPGKTQELKDRISRATNEVSQWKLDIRDDTEVTMDHIRSISQQKAQSTDGLDMIIIDYLQLISIKSGRGRSRQEEVAEISRTCKMLAKQLKVPVMVLVQLNRETKDNEEKFPSKADIRESAAIAADSDIILIIHRKYRDDSTDPKATFILDKNRGGPADKMFSVRCVLEKNIFQDLRVEESFETSSEDGSFASLETPSFDGEFSISEEELDNLFDESEEDLFMGEGW